MNGTEIGQGRSGAVETRVVYTCWPFRGVVCGVALVAIGAALLLQPLFPDSPEILWGIVLIGVGAFTILWSGHRGESQ